VTADDSVRRGVAAVGLLLGSCGLLWALFVGSAGGVGADVWIWGVQIW